MSNSTDAEILARLEAEVADLRARQAALLGQLPSARRGRRTARLRRRVAIGLVALLVALLPLALLAANPFTDLVPGSVHNANIDAIYNAHITTGCVPAPDPNPQYCPTANVTREEMASFLARTAGLGTNPPVANALTVEGYSPNELVRVAYNGNTAANATLPLIGAQSPLPNAVAGVSITAPGPGFVHLTIGGVLRLSCAGCVATVILGGGPTLTWAAADGPLAVAHTWVVPVTTAGAVNLPVLVLVLNPASATPVPSGTFAKPTLTAIFVPFGSTGGSTLGTEETTP